MGKGNKKLVRRIWNAEKWRVKHLGTPIERTAEGSSPPNGDALGFETVTMESVTDTFKIMLREASRDEVQRLRDSR